jgi:hypothetical protein
MTTGSSVFADDDVSFTSQALRATTESFQITLPHLSLITDRAEMLVDPEHDQDELSGDA